MNNVSDSSVEGFNKLLNTQVPQRLRPIVVYSVTLLIWSPFYLFLLHNGAPWWLIPSINFPFAFSAAGILGVTFALSLCCGLLKFVTLSYFPISPDKLFDWYWKMAISICHSDC